MRRFLAAKTLIRPGVGDPVAGEDEQWYRWYWRFHYAFAAFAVVAVLGALTDSTISREAGVIGSLVALLLLGWFWFRGRWSNMISNGDALLYFGVALPLLGVALRLYDGFGLMIFAAFWQGFVYFRTPPAIVYAAILSAVITIGYSDIGLGSPNEFRFAPGLIFAGVFGLVVAGMMALYIEGIGREADRRQQLLNQLRETQNALARQEREAGMMHERRRLAGEIHDTVAQHFTSIVTNLEAAEGRAPTNPDAAWKHVLAAREAARQGIRDARSMVHALQPEVLEGRSLSDALRHIVEDARTRGGIHIQLREEGQPAPLDRVQETILLRALQEAILNVQKHAQATEVEAALAWLDDEVILDIQDDGVGFDPNTMPEAEAGHHMGLITMRQRVEGAGGTWMIDSTRGEGTSLAVSFPLPTDQEENQRAE